MTATNARQTLRTTIMALVGFVLALLLFASVGVNQAQAAHGGYHLASFNCGGAHNSGSYDTNGNLYIPCSTLDTAAVKNAGTADKEAPSHIRVLSPEGAPLKTITIPQNTDGAANTANDIFVFDVAPNADGSVLYMTSKTNGTVNPVKKFTVNGTSGTWSAFAPERAWKLTTDANGFVYISDNDTGRVVKYNPNGTVKTSFNAKPSGGGHIGGVAVNANGSVLYVTQMNGTPSGLPNKVNRFNSTDGTTYMHDSAKSVGGNFDENKPCATNLYTDPAETAVPYWIGYFAYSWDIGLDAQENLYALSTTCHEVHKFLPNGSWAMGMKVNEEDRYSTDYADNARPHGLTVARNGEVYIGEASAKMDLPAPTAPDTSITAGPTENSTDPDTTPTFSFTSNPTGATFQCKFDGEAYAKCTSPHTRVSPLSAGKHTFYVKAINANGTEDATPATRTWTVGNDPTETCLAEVKDGPGTLKEGTSNSETVSGTVNEDKICAYAGNDTIVGGAENDHVDGGSGSDTISYAGAPGRVSVHLYYISNPTYKPDAYEVDGDAGTGYDSPLRNIENATGGNDHDFLYGTLEDNTLTGGPGVDSMESYDGTDIIYARDNVVDEKIDCGAGAGDKAIVDPSEASKVVGCEMIDTGGDYEAPTNPTISITGSTGSNAGYTRSRMVTLKLSATDNVGVTKVSFADNDGEWDTTADYKPTMSYTLPANASQGTNYVSVRFHDAENNISEIKTASIKLDTVAPSVIKTEPANYATGIRRGTAIVAHFAASDLKASTVNATSYYLRKQGTTSNVTMKSYSYDAATKRAIMWPSAALAPNTTYVVYINSRMTDKAGNPIKDQNANVAGYQMKTWSFKTGS